MTHTDAGSARRVTIGLWVAAVAVVVPILLVDTGAGVVAAFTAAAIIAARTSIWLAICTAAWTLVFVAVLTIPGPYDSAAGRAAVPVLGLFAACFLAAWYLGRRLAGSDQSQPMVANSEGATTTRRTWWMRTRPARPELTWPPDTRLTAFLLVLLVIALIGAALKFRGALPPLFADNPDAAREMVRLRSNIYVGLLSEAWTLGMAISLLRALGGKAQGRWPYFLLAAVFVFGAALGASKNSVLIGIVPALVATLSTRRESRGTKRPVTAWVVILIGLVAVGAAVFLGGQRTAAGTGAFEDRFRAQYGGNAIYTSVGSLDLSLSSSVETFGRFWEQRDQHPPAWGRYSLTFTGSVGDRLLGPAHPYDITVPLSKPYYMNTATFVAIPLMDYGPIGAAAFLGLIGLCVGFTDRRLESSTNPASQLGRALVIYFATFGVYELYPLIQPVWLSLVPGLVAFYLVVNPSRLGVPAWKH